ncbi:leucine-rich repeat-containing protein 59-like [Saccoglossus kowalevskii]|uniref:Leucine-rich repeat-containing protein 59-like n=1 Tax=Saccoglossus kowalevskii TaxID=10224 RepID=A0ABM0GWC3_SACKO|nr:PREDICTED: leucine-rich repeat-containing protein 59-like [Saccoglossus kowalevskii]
MPSKEQSLKERLDGNELDLSMSGLLKVPVKELAALPKATRLDLSCNQLTYLPDAFGTLTHLVKIDLSKNAVSDLPPSIGGLVKLQYLDLLGNQLQSLPVSFANLRSLKWLDLKSNPLSIELQKVAGDCLDDRQCKECAKQVTSYMRAVQSELERQKQKRLNEEKAREAAKAAEQDRQREMKKKQKQAEKERKRREYEAKQAAKRQEQLLLAEQERIVKEEIKKQNSSQPVKSKPDSSVTPLSVMFLFTIVVAIGSIIFGVCFYCQNHGNNPACQDIFHRIQQVTGTIRSLFQ